jgi:Leu/Phe-tRNA-protein transferase
LRPAAAIARRPDDPMHPTVALTPDLLIRAYAAGVFPMCVTTSNAPPLR